MKGGVISCIGSVRAERQQLIEKKSSAVSPVCHVDGLSMMESSLSRDLLSLTVSSVVSGDFFSLVNQFGDQAGISGVDAATLHTAAYMTPLATTEW